MAQVHINQAQLIRVLIALVAVVLGFVAMFTAWWTVDATVTGQFQGQPITNSASFDAKPYSAGRFEDASFGASGKGLGTEVIVTGILFTFALIGTVGFLLLEIASIVRPSLPAIVRVGIVLVTALVGAAAVLYTALAWPPGVDDKIGFFDSESQTLGDTNAKQTYGAGIGWYFAIASSFVLPLAALYTRMFSPANAPSDVPGAPAPAPWTPVPNSAMPPASAPPAEPAQAPANAPPVRRAAILRPKAKE